MRKFVTGVLAIATVWMFMRATEMRILMQQEIVLGTSGSASLVCRYFNGTGTTINIFWYSPSNVLGRDSCALVHTDLHSLRR